MVISCQRQLPGKVSRPRRVWHLTVGRRAQTFSMGAISGHLILRTEKHIPIFLKRNLERGQAAFLEEDVLGISGAKFVVLLRVNSYSVQGFRYAYRVCTHNWQFC